MVNNSNKRVVNEPQANAVSKLEEYLKRNLIDKNGKSLMTTKDPAKGTDKENPFCVVVGCAVDVFSKLISDALSAITRHIKPDKNYTIIPANSGKVNKRR